MAKRRAEDSLDKLAPSPASKKARVEETDEQSPPHSNGNGARSRAAATKKGQMDDNNSPDRIEDDMDATALPSRQKAPTEGYDDLYLDTVNRSLLDFDFEKLCSVTLSNINVYACLVCGRYFQGRGPKSQAYFHALDETHHVYINTSTKKVYVLPEGYEVHSASLNDIRFVVDPHLPKKDVLRLDADAKKSYDVNGKEYAPGFVGLNNIKANDYFNVITHLLAHVPPLRNFFMLEDLSSAPQLAQRFSILVRKLWNPRAFKSHVSPHELLQEVAQRSNKRFSLTQQSDPVDFLSWFLNNLHLALGGSKTTPGSSIVQRVFQGRLKIESQAITARADAGDRLRFEDADVATQVSRFMILTLDLPPAPLFQDELDANIIPQVPLPQILAKYDGVHAQERLNNRVRYRLVHPLPPFLLLHVKRFSANKFVAERNPTIVTFAARSLDMAPYVEPSVDKDAAGNAKFPAPGEPIWYDLLANVTHEAVRSREDSVEGETEKKVWRVQLKDKAADRWVEVQDLFVENASAETLFTKESYVMVWERRRMPPRATAKAE